MSTEEERMGRLLADVDTRMVDLWALIWAEPNALTGLLEDEAARGAFTQVLRHAYAQGYQDALLEDAQGRRGELARTHGYAHH